MQEKQKLPHLVAFAPSLQSKDICVHLQDGLLKVTTEMQTVSPRRRQTVFDQSRTERQHVFFLSVCLQAWRTYYQYHSEYVCAEGKLKDAEKQEEKQKQSAAKKLERLIEKVNGGFFLVSFFVLSIYFGLW